MSLNQSGGHALADCNVIGKASSKTFRTWFQWISQAVEDKIQLECLNHSSYWSKLQDGLLHGHADQRKYCIGIIRQSLLAAQDDISTPTMQFHMGKRGEYLKAYDQYSALFETIVLDRYANQVQACLPELTKLMHAEITPSMASTLLSAALNPLVQDGVRKLVGNWYIDYTTKVSLVELVGVQLKRHINPVTLSSLAYHNMHESPVSVLSVVLHGR
jgi:tRNA guanosine-2'-O-methyltransferase